MQIEMKKVVNDPENAVCAENQIIALQLMDLAIEDFDSFKEAVKTLDEQQTLQIGWWFQRLAYWSNANPQERKAFTEASETKKENMVAEFLN